MKTQENRFLLAGLFLAYIAILMYANAFGQTSNICGNVAAYNASGKWEDLPGCTGDDKTGTSEWDSPASLLAKAKLRFQAFYAIWNNNQMKEDPYGFKAQDCRFFKDGNSAWSDNPDLEKAAAAFQVEADKVTAAWNNYANNIKPTMDAMFNPYYYCEIMMIQIDKAFAEAEGKSANYVEIASGERSVLAGQIETLEALVKTADEKQIPGTMLIGGSGDVKETTLSVVKNVLLPKYKAFSQNADNAALDAYLKELAPYLDVLSGEKEELFKERYGLYFYGKDGVLLKTPAEIANSSHWFFIGNPPCVVCPMWELSGVIFDGMTISGYTSRKTGYGTYPPNEEFH